MHRPSGRDSKGGKHMDAMDKERMKNIINEELAMFALDVLQEEEPSEYRAAVTEGAAAFASRLKYAIEHAE